jgi:hypothetical protein
MGGSNGSRTLPRYPTRLIGNGEPGAGGRNAAVRRAGAPWPQKEAAMPAETEKQRKFMGAELQRKREGKKTRTGMSEDELEKMASKGHKKS